MVRFGMRGNRRRSSNLSISAILFDEPVRHQNRIVREITSRQNPLVSEYRAVASRQTPALTSVLLEGAHLIEEALAAGITVRSAAVGRRALADRNVAAVLERLERGGADIVAVSEAVLRAMSPVPAPSGLVAIAEIVPIPLARAFARPPQLVLIVFDLQDPGNTGAVVRSAEALNSTGVIFCGASADPFGWKALRGSMGSAFRLPVASIKDGGAAIAAARAAGLAIVAAMPAGGRSVVELDLTRPTAFLLGGEGRGLDPSIAAAADDRATIPMAAHVESLNVSVAAALLAWEANRQRVRRQEPDRHE
jgi:TrmH family RNA methyltransferase